MKVIKDILKKFGVTFFAKVVDGEVTDEEARDAGLKAGKWLTDNARGQVGASWEQVEQVMQNKLDKFMVGLKNGLNYDDAA